MREEFRQLSRTIEGCSCGRIHTCPVEKVVIGEDATAALPGLLAGVRNVLLVHDSNTERVCGARVRTILTEAGFSVSEALFVCGEGELVIPDEESIDHIRSRLSEDTDMIVGIGAGVLQDLCKYVSYFAKIPYTIVATAPSMDGYASSGAAMILSGMKVTVSAAPPKYILADTRVLRDAPMEMIRAGAGDILGKISCLSDWRLGSIINHEYICEEIIELVRAEIDSVRADLSLYEKRDPEGIGRLMRSLITVGAAMSYAGNSRPASGSEHHLSHFFEITGILRNVPYLPHGIDVGYGTQITCFLRHYLAEKDPSSFFPAPPISRRKAGLEKVYGKLTDEVISLQEKQDGRRLERYSAIKERWEQIREELISVPTQEEYAALAGEIGFDMTAFRQFYGDARIREAIIYAKELKDRYTILNLLADVGLLEKAAEEYLR